jgi:hypothetical protein
MSKRTYIGVSDLLILFDGVYSERSCRRYYRSLKKAFGLEDHQKPSFAMYCEYAGIGMELVCAALQIDVVEPMGKKVVEPLREDREIW